jgi:hypothetical protein
MRSHFRTLGQTRPMRQQNTATPTPRSANMASLDQPLGDWVVGPRNEERRVNRGIARECTGGLKASVAKRRNVNMAEDHVDVV